MNPNPHRPHETRLTPFEKVNLGLGVALMTLGLVDAYFFHVLPWTVDGVLFVSSAAPLGLYALSITFNSQA